MTNSKIAKIKNLIREWYGTLSIEEIMSNEELIELFQKIEKSLQELECSEQLWSGYERTAY